MAEGASLGFDALAYDRLAGPQLRSADPAGGTAFAAIVGLTRGYSDTGRYDRLIARNRSIYESINRFRTDPYPLVLWHEGNISDADQRYIVAHDRNSDVRFVDVSALF